MKIFIIALLLLILYNMFSTHQCFPFMCFLNQREGFGECDNASKTPAPMPCSPTPCVGKTPGVCPKGVAPTPCPGKSPDFCPGGSSPTPCLGKTNGICPKGVSPTPCTGKIMGICPQGVSPTPCVGKTPGVCPKGVAPTPCPIPPATISPWTICNKISKENAAKQEASAVAGRAHIQKENDAIQNNYIAKSAPGQPPIVTVLPPNTYAATINTATIGANTAAVNALYSAEGAFGSLISKVNALSGTINNHERMAHINRPDYMLLGCRADAAIEKYELKMAENQTKYSGGW